MTISWGNKLLIAFIGFVGIMGVLVYKSMNQHVELVSKDYYKDELRYQDNIDGANNANKISSVQLSQSSSLVTIKLPEELNGLSTIGDIWFYCPSQSAADRKFEMQLNKDGIMEIDKNKLAAVTYLVKISWQTGDEKYFNEQRLALK